MLTIQVWNVSDLAPVSDYKYAVYVNREQIATGLLKDHTREDGWAVLVKKIAEGHIAVTEMRTPDGQVRTQQATLVERPAGQKAVPVACGKVGKGYRICVKPAGHKERCKFVNIVPAPAGAR